MPDNTETTNESLLLGCDFDAETAKVLNGKDIIALVTSKDGTKLYYVASNYPNGNALWERDLDKGSTTIKAQGVAFTSFDLADDDKIAYYAQGGRIKKLDIAAGRISDIDFECFHNDYPAG